MDKKGKFLPSKGCCSVFLQGGYTDSLCCNKDNPVANCGTSGAGDYIEFQGAQPPPAGPTTTAGLGNR